MNVPEELREARDDLFWQLQRIAHFFPAYGTDRDTYQLAT